MANKHVKTVFILTINQITINWDIVFYLKYWKKILKVLAFIYSSQNICRKANIFIVCLSGRQYLQKPSDFILGPLIALLGS